PGHHQRSELRCRQHRRGDRQRSAQPHAQRRPPGLQPGRLADQVLHALEVDLHEAVRYHEVTRRAAVAPADVAARLTRARSWYAGGAVDLLRDCAEAIVTSRSLDGKLVPPPPAAELAAAAGAAEAHDAADAVPT